MSAHTRIRLLYTPLRSGFLGILMAASGLQGQTVPQALAHPDSDASRTWSTLADQRDLVAAHPADPARYIDLAYTLTDAGIGDEASDVARKAIAVAPASSFAFSAAGWVLHHNAIGVDYGKGYSYTESLAAYRKAIELNPGDLDTRQSLANSLEYNQDGLRYAPDSHLPEAIEIYLYVKAHQPVVQPQVEDNLLVDLFYAGQFDTAAQEAATQLPTPVREGVAIAAIAASQGAEAAIARADRITGDPQRRTAALNFAAEGLWNMRLYPQAAALLTAGIGDGAASASTLAKIRLFTDLKPYQATRLPADDPRSPVQQLLSSAAFGTLTDAEAASLFTRQAYPREDQWQRLLRDMRNSLGAQQSLMIQTGLPAAAIRDMLLGKTLLTTEPGGGPGWRVDVQVLALPPRHFFVTSEGGAFKIVASAGDFEAVGNEVLALLHEGSVAEARTLLDWQRDQLQKGGGDDPLGGPLFSRFWTSDSKADPSLMEAAAVSLLSQTDTAVPFLPRLNTLRDNTPPGTRRVSLDLLVAQLSVESQDSSRAAALSEELLRRYPDSITAIRLAGRADALRKDWTGWNAMLDTRLVTHGSDRDLLLEKALAQESEGHYPQARTTLHTLLVSGRAFPADYNAYAWLSLFDTTVDEQAFNAAQQANLGSKPDFAALHTLACVYAALGRTTEARQTLLQAMLAANLAEPDGAIWFGFGLIYEQFGDRAAATAAYKRVEKPDGVFSPVDTYVLAQAHLTQLQAKQPPALRR